MLNKNEANEGVRRDNSPAAGHQIPGINPGNSRSRVFFTGNPLEIQAGGPHEQFSQVKGIVEI